MHFNAFLIITAADFDFSTHRDVTCRDVSSLLTGLSKSDAEPKSPISAGGTCILNCRVLNMQTALQIICPDSGTGGLACCWGVLLGCSAGVFVGLFVATRGL